MPTIFMAVNFLQGRFLHCLEGIILNKARPALRFPLCEMTRYREDKRAQRESSLHNSLATSMLALLQLAHSHNFGK